MAQRDPLPAIRLGLPARQLKGFLKHFSFGIDVAEWKSLLLSLIVTTRHRMTLTTQSTKGCGQVGLVGEARWPSLNRVFVHAIELAHLTDRSLPATFHRASQHRLIAHGRDSVRCRRSPSTHAPPTVTAKFRRGDCRRSHSPLPISNTLACVMQFITNVTRVECPSLLHCPSCQHNSFPLNLSDFGPGLFAFALEVTDRRGGERPNGNRFAGSSPTVTSSVPRGSMDFHEPLFVTIRADC